MTAGGREWAVRIALMVGAPAVVLAAVELALRAVGAGYEPAFWIRTSGGYQAGYETNDRFGWRFFPQAVARVPVPESVAMPKRAKRVVVVGESAAMGFPEPAYGVARMLQALLGDSHEVVNAAMTAIDSHGVAEIARDSLAIQPDLLVVMAGNNEFVGPVGPDSLVGGQPVRWLTRFRVGQLLRRALEPRAAQEWRGMERFLDRTVPPGDPRLERVYGRFAANMREIASLPVAKLMLTVPVNRELNFRGTSVDDDALRFRADSRIQAAIRNAAGASLLDAAAAFPGADAFYEHVHLTPEGNYRLARLIAERIEPGRAWPSLDDVARRLALTEWDRWRMASVIDSLLARPPFEKAVPARASVDPAASREIHKAARAAHPEDVAQRLRYAEFLRATGGSADAIPELRTLIERLPGRKTLHAALGSARNDTGQHEAASTEFRRALELDPSFDLALFGLALVAERRGALDEARGWYERAIAVNPDSPETRNNLGLLHLKAGRNEDARREFAEVIRRDPRFVGGRYNLGMALSRLGKVDEAKAEFAAVGTPEAKHALATIAAGQRDWARAESLLREVIDARSGFAAAHYDLGAVLTQQNRHMDAVRSYEAAIAIQPGYADAWNNLGTAWARQGRFADAARCFEKAVELRPDFASARANLDRARRAATRR